MKDYPKINSVYKRDMDAPRHPFIIGEYSTPEIDYLKDNQWEWTEKVDGINIKVVFNGENFRFGGKSEETSIPAHLFARLQDIFNDEMFAKMTMMFVKPNIPTEVILYGEGFGYKIQGKVGIDYLKGDIDFYLFDIRIGRWWLKRDNVVAIAEELGLLAPVIVGYGTLDEAIAFVKKGFFSVFGIAQAEGLVLRPVLELLDRAGQRIITKVKVRDLC